MNLSQAAVVLRKRTPLEVVELSLLFLRGVRPDLSRRLAAITLVPLFVGGLALRYFLDWSWGVILPVFLVLSWLIELPYVVLAGQALFDQEIRLRAVLTGSMQRLLPFAAVLLFQVAVIAALLLTVVGPLFAMATYCFAIEAVCLERATARQGLRRARNLLRGRSGSGIQTVFLRGCLMVSCVLTSEVLGQALWSYVLDIGVESESLMDSGGSPFALFGLLASVPLTSYYRFLSYINERTILDGWDIQVAFLSLAKDSPTMPVAEAAE